MDSASLYIFYLHLAYSVCWGKAKEQAEGCGSLDLPMHCLKKCYFIVSSAYQVLLWNQVHNVRAMQGISLSDYTICSGKLISVSLTKNLNL